MDAIRDDDVRDTFAVRFDGGNVRRDEDFGGETEPFGDRESPGEERRVGDGLRNRGHEFFEALYYELVKQNERFLSPRANLRIDDKRPVYHRFDDDPAVQRHIERSWAKSEERRAQKRRIEGAYADRRGAFGGKICADYGRQCA